jgi:hypothetical protein
LKFEQCNPVPVPAYGPIDSIQSTLTTVFDWQYALANLKLLNLYDKGQAATWNASDLPWDTAVDLERLFREQLTVGIGEFMNRVMAPPRKLTDREALDYRTNAAGYLLSQFLHGEQGALIACAKLISSLPFEEGKWYAANQATDEARHVEVYHRYLTQKLGIAYEVHPSLRALFSSIVESPHWDLTFLGMQIMVEGLALAAFSGVGMLLTGEPLISEIIRRVALDESRHVAFGVIALRELYSGGLSAQELREREDFVIHASELLRERMVMTPVIERLGWEPAIWNPWVTDMPFMKAFRQTMFTKIVPNLRSIGLLTPRVRAAFDAMGLMRYAELKDSIEDATVRPPDELISQVADFMKTDVAQRMRQSGN